jgi:hypothetical protein
VLLLRLELVQAERWVQRCGDSVVADVRLIDKSRKVGVEFLEAEGDGVSHELTVLLLTGLLKVHLQGLQVQQCLPK